MQNRCFDSRSGYILVHDGPEQVLTASRDPAWNVDATEIRSHVLTKNKACNCDSVSSEVVCSVCCSFFGLWALTGKRAAPPPPPCNAILASGHVDWVDDHIHSCPCISIGANVVMRQRRRPRASLSCSVALRKQALPGFAKFLPWVINHMSFKPACHVSVCVHCLAVPLCPPHPSQKMPWLTSPTSSHSAAWEKRQRSATTMEVFCLFLFVLSWQIKLTLFFQSQDLFSVLLHSRLSKLLSKLVMQDFFFMVIRLYRFQNWLTGICSMGFKKSRGAAERKKTDLR